MVVHIYDVTNSGNDKTNNTIMQINKFFKDGIGLGGIFHSAVQVHLFFGNFNCIFFFFAFFCIFFFSNLVNWI